MWIQQSGSGAREREREEEGGREESKGMKAGRPAERERECQNIQNAGGGLLQPASFRLGGIIFYWGGVKTN